ncbi:LecH [Celeribacter indicus]|uniref:LecH n=2 Tax=Celeribacter indicus TaxID=1208324 RepID=A0A0B5E2A7_9RHOB|nr:LecH [Celeribacter indicus]
MPIALEAMDMWHRIEEIVGDDCGFSASGQVRVAEDDAQMHALRMRAEEGRRRGFGNEQLIGAELLRELLPAASPHLVGALHAPADGAADPHRTIRAFRAAAEADGVCILEYTAVHEVRREGAAWRLSTSRGDHVAGQIVNCAGAWGAKLAALWGEEIPLGLKASMMIVTERLYPFLRPVVSAQGRALSFKQTAQGTLVIGGGLQGKADIDVQKSFVDFAELSKGARAAVAVFPGVADVRITRSWAGIEARTEDLLPVIGPSATVPDVWHAFGFSGHGFELIPVVGAIMADLVTQAGTAREIAPFAVERLREARVQAG